MRDPPAILAHWNEYFPAISNEEFPHTPIHSPDPIRGPVPPVATTEGCEENEDVWKLMGHREAKILTVLFNKLYI